MQREVLVGAVRDVHERLGARQESLLELCARIKALNPTPDEAENLVLAVQGALQDAGLKGAMLFDVDPSFDALRESLTELQRSLDNTDHPADEMDLSRDDRQRRDDETAEVES